MKTLTVFSSLVFLLCAGCSTTYYIPRDSRSDLFVEARRNMQGRKVNITPTEGSAFSLDSLSLRSDTLVGRHHDTHAAVALLLSNVDEIDVTSVLQGIWRGIIRTVAISATVGILGGVSYVQSLSEDQRSVAWGYVALFGVVGALEGARFLSTDHYRFVEQGNPRIGEQTHFVANENLGMEGISPSEVITLKLFPVEEETPEAISIPWDGKFHWLPKSKIKFERLPGGLINLTVPKSLLEATQEK
jgi:hypothetical protein